MCFSTNWLLRIALFLLLTSSVTLAENTDQPQTVTIVGTIQTVLGCTDDWQPDCENTQLEYDPDDDLWYASFDLPAGSYEYQTALDGAQAELNGIPLVLSENTTVRFFYNHTSHWLTDRINSIIAGVPGSYQGEIGCSGEWQPELGFKLRRTGCAKWCRYRLHRP